MRQCPETGAVLQDEEYGGFGGAHCMVPSGYSSLLSPLAGALDVRLSCPVALIQDDPDGVQVTTASGAHSRPWGRGLKSLDCLVSSPSWSPTQFEVPAPLDVPPPQWLTVNARCLMQPAQFVGVAAQRVTRRVFRRR